MKTILHIEGTHCHACKALIEDVARELPGIQSCTVDFETGMTEIEHDATFSVDGFRKEIETLGEYRVKTEG